MVRVRHWKSLGLLALLLVAVGCGPVALPTPGAVTPTGEVAAPTQTAPPEPMATIAVPAATTTAEEPTAMPPPPTPELAPPDAEGLRAWGVAADGTVYVLDARYRVYELAPDTLSPAARSAPLVETTEEAPAHLVAGEQYVFAGTGVVSQTVVLDRGDLSVVANLEGYGPMALEPGKRLLMVPLGLEKQWPWGNREIWAYDLSDLSKPAGRVHHWGNSLNDLVVDPASRRLYVVTHNITSSPPHRGQRYEVYSLDPLTKTASFEWERGSLTRPVVHPRTGEVLGSRVGLNRTRRFLMFDLEGQEVRNLPTLDGQPAIDAAGEWIYLLRQRGLWVLREQDLSLQAVLPFPGTPPRDLALSPDGGTLYLFGNGWLTALSTTELRAQGVAPLSPFPTAWIASEPWDAYLQARVYPSPGMEADGAPHGVAFLQLLAGTFNVLETYRSDDGGHSWQLLTSLVEPDLAGALLLGLSPEFSQDQTLAALRGGMVVLRSVDAGQTWEPWQPRIAFTSEREGNREIYTMDQEGGDVRRVTADPAADENPAWSPAWTRLAFQSDRSGNWDIYSVRADCEPSGAGGEEGCDLRQLTDDAADDLLPACSPDGRSIAFVSTRDGNPEIYLMDSDGGNPRRLTFHPSGDWRPAWLPDSRHLVFVSDRSGDNDIYQMAVPPLEAFPLASEPALVPVVVDPADDRDPAVTSRGEMLFLSDRDGVLRAYKLRIGEPYTRPFATTETDRDEAHPAWLPGEGSWILLSAERDGSPDVYRAILGQYVALAASPAFDGHPAGEATEWEPDEGVSLAWLEELQE